MRPQLNSGTLARLAMGGADHLFEAYFHEDCLLDDPDWESVVLRFRDSEPFELVRETQSELEDLLKEWRAPELENQLLGPTRLSSYNPRPEGLSVRAWVEEIVHLLAGGWRRTSDRLEVSIARRRAATVARSALADTHDPILASRELSSLRFAVGVANDDPDFTVFVAVNSETDALPLGSERSQWSPEALARLEREVADARDWAMTQSRQALENIVRRFGGAG
jgi:hypothetical protein